MSRQPIIRVVRDARGVTCCACGTRPEACVSVDALVTSIWTAIPPVQVAFCASCASRIGVVATHITSANPARMTHQPNGE